MKHSAFFYLALLTLTIMPCQASWWFELTPVQKLLQTNPTIQYQKCFNEVPFDFQPFPLSINPASHPTSGYFLPTFIVQIPQGKVQSQEGWVLSNNRAIAELTWKNMTVHLQRIAQLPEQQYQKIPARVATITQTAYHNYWHWLTEVLCRLALLEMSHVEFDYLYVPQSTHFMKETLQLWGIDQSKIIEPTDYNFAIQADTLIVPSLVSSINHGLVLFACYVQHHLLEYVKQKLLQGALQATLVTPPSKRIFISRKDAPQRNIINEDEVFACFEKYGFVHYELDKLPVADQIMFFNTADIIVCPQGTGLANSIFCQPTTHVIELFQGLNDCTFWYLSQQFGFKYFPIATTDFVTNYVQAWKGNTIMSLAKINNFIEQHPEIFNQENNL